MYNMAELYNMDFSHTKPEPPCVCNSCRYNEGYIKDI